MTDSETPRRIWHALEPIHAVTYFAPHSLEAISATGTKGFWMGYFAARSAPLGAVEPSIVTSLFYNFSPSRTNRALPDAWKRTSPSEILAARAAGAAEALRSVTAEIAEHTRRALPLAEAAARAADCGGRALAQANQALPTPQDHVERLWRAVTILREHRGDGHVAALVTHRISGIEALVLSGATKQLPPELLRESRGWTQEQWDEAKSSLADRGLLDSDDQITTSGAELMESVEHTTDLTAAQPFEDGLTPDGASLLVTALKPISKAVMSYGFFPVPNPIGINPV